MSRYPPCPVPREGLQLRSFTLRSAGPPEAVWPGKSGVPSLSVVRRASCRGGRWVPDTHLWHLAAGIPEAVNLRLLGFTVSRPLTVTCGGLLPCHMAFYPSPIFLRAEALESPCAIPVLRSVYSDSRCAPSASGSWAPGVCRGQMAKASAYMWLTA